jgi:hypothetical protein
MDGNSLNRPTAETIMGGAKMRFLLPLPQRG